MAGETAMPNALPGGQVVGEKTSPQRADTAPILLKLEELLSEQLTLVGKEAYWRRLEIEAELADVRLQLARLGVEPSK
jgi:hypothetical protein